MKKGFVALALALGFTACDQKQDQKKKEPYHPRRNSSVSQNVEVEKAAPAEGAQVR